MWDRFSVRQESLDLFKMWANHKDFARKPVVIAFTKRDLFNEQFDLPKFQAFYKDVRRCSTIARTLPPSCFACVL